jgi:hypothetical protein
VEFQEWFEGRDPLDMEVIDETDRYTDADAEAPRFVG